MNTNTLTTLLEIAGLLHLGLICAGALMPRVVDLKRHIAVLPLFIRQLYWVYYSFIGFCLVSFGLITVIFAPSLAAGTDLARAVCALFAGFWTLRLIVASLVFDVQPYLTHWVWRWGYYATNVAFTFLPLVYGYAAVR